VKKQAGPVGFKAGGRPSTWNTTLYDMSTPYQTGWTEVDWKDPSEPTAVWWVWVKTLKMWRNDSNGQRYEFVKLDLVASSNGGGARN